MSVECRMSALETIPESQPTNQVSSVIVPVPEKKKKPNNGWTDEQEELMANWSDIASCYRLLHDKAEKRYNKFNLGMTIPVILLSTLTGTANFGMGSLFGNDQSSQRYASLAIGGVSLVAGLLTTLGNFLRFAQNMESHRVASVAWGKFQRSVAVELALHPTERQESIDFLKVARSELDRLIEQSPAIPQKTIDDFEAQFKEATVKKPDICNHLERTHIYRDPARGFNGIGIESAIPTPQRENAALDRIQSFVVKARSLNGTPRNIADL